MTIRDENLFSFEVKTKYGKIWQKRNPVSFIHRFEVTPTKRNKFRKVGKRELFYLVSKKPIYFVRIDGETEVRFKRGRRRILLGKLLEEVRGSEIDGVLSWINSVREWGKVNGFGSSGFPVPGVKKVFRKTIPYSKLSNNSPVKNVLRAYGEGDPKILVDILKHTRGGYWVTQFNKDFGTGQIWGDGKVSLDLEIYMAVLTVDPPKSGEKPPRLFVRKRFITKEYFNSRYHILKKSGDLFRKKPREYLTAFVLQYGLDSIKKDGKLGQSILDETTNYILGVVGWKFKEKE